jgi:DNA-directed RNA polymerase specialized sigma24 family protein
MLEAYVSACAHLADFAGRARFSTWLLRIAVNQAFDRRDHELGGLLEQSVDALPEGFRTVFMLRAVEHARESS